MTRKDYKEIALMFSNHLTNAERESNVQAARSIDSLAHNMAGILKADNPRFDRGRFLKACGLRG